MSRNYLNSIPEIQQKEIWKKPESALAILKVEWLDSYTESGWAEYQTVDTLTVTYGLFVGENEDFLTLAMTKEEGYWGNQWHIPIPNIRTITVISNGIESTEHDN